jgi:hypothetical protein
VLWVIGCGCVCAKDPVAGGLFLFQMKANTGMHGKITG